MANRVRLSVVVVASSFALVGCSGGSESGIADLSAAKILAAAEKQVADEKFVTVEGKDKSTGGIDLDFAGEESTGSISLGDGMKAEVLKVDGKAYFKADKEFFQSTGAPAEAGRT